MMARPAMPPTTPPTIAPVFEELPPPLAAEEVEEAAEPDAELLPVAEACVVEPACVASGPEERN